MGTTMNEIGFDDRVAIVGGDSRAQPVTDTGGTLPDSLARRGA